MRFDKWVSDRFKILGIPTSLCFATRFIPVSTLDFMMKHTTLKGLIGTSLKTNSFTHLDFANDVGLLIEGHPRNTQPRDGTGHQLMYEQVIPSVCVD